MAQKIDDGEFWLPSELFSDDDDIGADYGGPNSDLSSPVESLNGSTETEGDDDDYVSVLSRSIWKASDYASMGRKMYGSPESYRCCSNYRVASPTEAKATMNLDLLYQAAEEVARLRMAEEIAAFQFQKPRRDPPPLSFRNEARIAYLKLQAAQFQKMKQQQQLIERGIWGLRADSRPVSAVRPAGNWSISEVNQQRRLNQAVTGGVLADYVLKKERNGTGVFLPRRFASTETRKKSDSSSSYANLSARPTFANQRSLPVSTWGNQKLRLPQDLSF